MRIGVIVIACFMTVIGLSQEELSKEEHKEQKDSVRHLKDSLWKVKFQKKLAEDKKKRVLFTVVPGPYAREGGGVGLMVLPMLIYKLDTADHVTPPSYTQMFLLGSSTGTFIGFINQQFFFKQDNWRLQVGGGGGSPRNRYYGIGNSLGEDYFWYRQNTAFVWANAYRRLYKRLYFGVGMSANWFKFKSADKDVDETYTDSVLVADGLNLDWATTITPSTRLQWDSRNSIFYPTKGVQAQITGWYGVPALGSEYKYQKLEAYYNQYIHFDPAERMVLAWRVYMLNTFGDVPFSQYAQYGGKSGKDLRGYISGQYSDRNMFDAQVEFRWTFWRRLGAAFFFGTGRVFPDYKEFLQGPWLPAGGVGLRYQVMRAKRIQARLDFAYGREGFQMYFGIMESF